MKFEFETARLAMRLVQPGDAPIVTAYFQDKEVPWNLGRAPWPYALSDAESWITRMTDASQAGTEYAFVVNHAQHGLIGSVGMFKNGLIDGADIWEIGYWVGKPHWGHGYVTEAARGLLDWARHELGITQFISGHIKDNPSSGRVLTKLGFVPTGEISMYVRGRDCEVSAIRYICNLR